MDNRLIFLYQFCAVQASFVECLSANFSSENAGFETRQGELAMEGRGMVAQAYLLNMVGISV